MDWFWYDGLRAPIQKIEHIEFGRFVLLEGHVTREAVGSGGVLEGCFKVFSRAFLSSSLNLNLAFRNLLSTEPPK